MGLPRVNLTPRLFLKPLSVNKQGQHHPHPGPTVPRTATPGLPFLSRSAPPRMPHFYSASNIPCTLLSIVPSASGCCTV